MKPTYSSLVKAIILVCSLIPFSSTAQNYNSKMNISFNSYFQFDTSLFVKDGKSFYLKSNPSTYFATQCFDYDVAPDSVKLNTYLKQNAEKFDQLKKDSAARDSIHRLASGVYDLGKIKLNHGFFGMYKKTKSTEEGMTLHNLQFDTYAYGEHCFCEFQYKRSFGSDSSTLEDTAISMLFLDGLVTMSMEEVRVENDKIRNMYSIAIDTLPLENYWIHVYHKNGAMTRDSIFMSDLNSTDFKPRFTHYNRTFMGYVVISPELKHNFVDIHLENMKHYEFTADGIRIELRDVQSGLVSKYGWITIENSLGYPLELPFRFQYKNHLYDRLKTQKN